MRILFHMGHPAHVHLFKNVIRNLEDRGHYVPITTLDKDISISLLKAYNFKYQSLGKHETGIVKKALSLPVFDFKLFNIARKLRSDIFISTGSPYVAHVAFLLRKPHIAFGDSEDSKLIYKLSLQFTKTLCTPSCFLKDLGKKHVRYNGYHELAYLHPNYFQPDPSVLDDLNLSKDDKFIVLRFISWAASHDIGLRGIKKASDMIKSLEAYGRIFITSERKLSPELEKYRITCSPEKIHSLLYYSQLYIGEGGTMAVESAILGTPAIHIEANSKGVATGNFSGNFLELRDKYDLLYFYPDQEQALEKAIRILEDKNSKKEWQRKREKLLRDKIDVTAWMTDFIERYPESFYEYREGSKTIFI